MRIIAGELKGRRLETPFDRSVRPTADKVKEALFSILMNEIPGAKVCDLFAGTGNLGLEALSRGADFCWFGDHSRESIALIKENTGKYYVQDKCQIIHGDYRRVVGRIADKVDVFLLDPPYGKELLPKAMDAIAGEDKLAEGGVIVCEHNKYEDMPDEIAGFEKVKERQYGKVVLSIYM